MADLELGSFSVRAVRVVSIRPSFLFAGGDWVKSLPL